MLNTSFLNFNYSRYVRYFVFDVAFVLMSLMTLNGFELQETWAQDTESAKTIDTPVTSPVTPVSQIQNASQIQKEPLEATSVRPDPKRAAKKRFEKEERLEEMRYKHLWLAYSFVWIIVFVFIRQTWQRNQATVQRLDELKTRLAKLEEQHKASDE